MQYVGELIARYGQVFDEFGCYPSGTNDTELVTSASNSDDLVTHPQDATYGLAADILGCVDRECAEACHACCDRALWYNRTSVLKLNPLLIRLISRCFSERSAPQTTTEHRSPGRRRTDTTTQRHSNNGQLACDYGRASWSYCAAWRI